MDLDRIDPRGLDVAHDIAKLSFRFYSDQEALRLSVRRLTSPEAFDELGRPIARGLYDPALGPTSYDDGPCLSCGLGYLNCPGHFGHIELPISVPNPLLRKVTLQIMRASCWNCSCIRLNPGDLILLLARLYFEDAGMPKCGYAVEAFRGLRKRYSSREEDLAPTAPPQGDKEIVSSNLVKNWRAFFDALPRPIAKNLTQIGTSDVELVENNMLKAARSAWKRAQEKGELMPLRSQGWKHAYETILAYTMTRCPLCLQKPRPIRRGDRGRTFRMEAHGEILFSPTEIESHIEGLWKAHKEIFDMLFGLKGRDVVKGEEDPGHRRLFVRVVLVPPSRFRPTSVVGNMAYAAEHPQNLFFQRLLTEIDIIMVANEYGLEEEAPSAGEASGDEMQKVRRPTKARFAQAMSNMQEALRDLYDSSGMPQGGKGNLQMTGIRQQLEAKAGLFRQHMMGKRVNFSCRSVIGPDVFLDTNEIGIPESFAKSLTIPEPVIPANLARMQRAVLNGPSVYPGAVAVEDWTNRGEHRVVKFKETTPQRIRAAQAGLLLQNHIARPEGKRNSYSNARAVVDDPGVNLQSHAASIPKRVHRHLKTGDLVLFNRQPTLHRVSIMAHRVRVLPGDRTIRFHYANCGSYNADFDGDEMNVHVPQDYIARAEAEELMSSEKHYIVPTSGAPIRGLIQDHIAAATLLSRRDTFLNQEEFFQLLYSATEKLMSRPDRRDKKYDLPNPAVWKPRKLWTGKQLISSVLVVIRNGRPGLNLTSSTRTKANVLGSEESRVVFRGGELLQGIVDKSSLGSSMYGIVHAVQEAYGCESSDDFLSAMSRLCVYYMRSHGHTTGVDDLLLQAQGETSRSRILKHSVSEVGISVTNSVYSKMSKGDGKKKKEAGTLKEAQALVEEMIRRDGKEAEDRLDTAMKSELSKVSSSVMSACVPTSLKKSFPQNGFALMTNTGAKGSAVNAAQISCLLGSTVLEGKRVPRMGGSGATLPCFAPYDASPLAGGFISGRFLTGISPQEFFFHAMSGREGLLDTSLKTANSGYLQRCLVKHLEGIRLHYDCTVRDSDDSILQFVYGDDGIDPSKSRWLNERVGWQVANQKCLSNVDDNRRGTESSLPNGLRHSDESTIIETVSPGAFSRLGAISEKFDSAVKKAESDSKGSDVRNFLEKRYQSSVLEPGEAVGILAAQGVGEPSTQMTLNTFHHAGSSSAHVTLGIPRLRELLMTASKYPRTPSMTLPILHKDPEGGAKRLSQLLQNIRLADLLQKVEVQEKSIALAPGAFDWAIRTIHIVLTFPPEELYINDLGFGSKAVSNFVGDHFLVQFHKFLKRDAKRSLSGVGESESRSIKTYLAAAQTPNGINVFRTRLSDDDDGNSQSDTSEQNGISENEEDAKNNSGDQEEGNKPNPVEEYESSSEEDSELDDEGDKGQNSRSKRFDVQDPEAVATDSEFKKAKPTKTKKSGAKKKLVKSRVSSGARIDDKDEGLIFGQLGYIHDSLQDHNRQEIGFTWSLPVALYGKVDLAGLAREAAAELQVTHVSCILRSFIDRTPSGYSVITEGSNIPAVLDIGDDLIDFDRLESNDMFGILHMYGVEAMRSALIQEFVKVFDAYGIPVNIRHLRLIADYMTAHGSYRGFNRIAMDTTPSPFQRMTFETCVKFLTDSALHGTEDMMKNPSAALATGQLYEGGTGGFQLLQRV